MFEESVENFVLQWRTYAAHVQLFPHTEGSPLLECQVGNAIFHVFERTGPYNIKSGKAQLIIHPVTEKVQRSDEGGKRLDVRGISKIAARGLVLLKEAHMVVVDAGAPLVVGCFEEIGDDIALGDWLEFESISPVHGFVVPKRRKVEGEAASVDGI